MINIVVMALIGVKRRRKKKEEKKDRKQQQLFPIQLTLKNLVFFSSSSFSSDFKRKNNL